MAAVTRYRGVARWDGRTWIARVEDDNGYDRGTCTADQLEQVAPNIRALLESDNDYGGDERPELTVQVQLHPDIELSLQVANDLVTDSTHEVVGVVAALLAANMSVRDIAVLLASRQIAAAPGRALVMTNAGLLP